MKKVLAGILGRLWGLEVPGRPLDVEDTKDRRSLCFKRLLIMMRIVIHQNLALRGFLGSILGRTGGLEVPGRTLEGTKDLRILWVENLLKTVSVLTHKARGAEKLQEPSCERRGGLEVPGRSPQGHPRSTTDKNVVLNPFFHVA